MVGLQRYLAQSMFIKKLGEKYCLSRFLAQKNLKVLDFCSTCHHKIFKVLEELVPQDTKILENMLSLKIIDAKKYQNTRETCVFCGYFKKYINLSNFTLVWDSVGRTPKAINRQNNVKTCGAQSLHYHLKTCNA